MKLILFIFALILSTYTMNATAENGLITLQSQHSVSTTADRFEQLINDKGLKFFMKVDHSQNAAKNDLSLRPTQVILFGNPLAGTPLMNCQQSIAIDLPQKALFWEDEQGQTWLTYNDPSYLKRRHSIEGCDAVLEKISTLLSTLAIAASSK